MSCVLKTKKKIPSPTCYSSFHLLYQLLFTRHLSSKSSSLTASTSVPSICSLPASYLLVQVPSGTLMPGPGDTARLSTALSSSAHHPSAVPVTSLSWFSPSRLFLGFLCWFFLVFSTSKCWCAPWLWVYKWFFGSSSAYSHTVAWFIDWSRFRQNFSQ